MGADFDPTATRDVAELRTEPSIRRGCGSTKKRALLATSLFYIDTGAASDKHIPGFHRIFQAAAECHRQAVSINGALGMNADGSWFTVPTAWSRIDWPDVLLIGGLYDSRNQSRLLDESIRRNVLRAISQSTVTLVSGNDACALFDISISQTSSTEHSVRTGLGILPGIGYVGLDRHSESNDAFLKTLSHRVRPVRLPDAIHDLALGWRSLEVTRIGAAPLEFAFTHAHVRLEPPPDKGVIFKKSPGMETMAPLPARFERRPVVTRDRPSPRPRQAILFGGGLDAIRFDSPNGRPIASYIARCTGKARPLIVLLASAMGEKYHLVNDFYQGFSHLSVELADIALTGIEFSVQALELLDHADAIVQLGGVTPSRTQMQRAHGLDKRIPAAYQRGAVIFGTSDGAVALMGISPGGMTNFYSTMGKLETDEGYDVIKRDGAVHVERNQRLLVARRMVESGQMQPGAIALATGVGAHFEDEKLIRGFVPTGRCQLAWEEEEGLMRFAAIPTQGEALSAFILGMEYGICTPHRVPLISLTDQTVWGALPRLREVKPNEYRMDGLLDLTAVPGDVATVTLPF